MLVKKLVLVCAALSTLALSKPLLAQEAAPIDANALSKNMLSTDDASLSLPVNVTLRELYRMFNNKEKNHFSYTEFPHGWGDLGWKLESTLGFVSATQFANSHQLFYCWMRSNSTKNRAKYFTSTDPNCEGWEKPTGLGYFIGWVSSVQVEGSVPLYRCYIQLTYDHFDTLTSNCEGETLAKNEGILGYIFR